MLKRGSYAVGYTQTFRDEYEAEQARLEAERQEAIEINARLKQERLDKLKSERKAAQEKDERAIDANLEPKKQTLRRDWLANHPNETEKTFETKAWPHLRANLKTELQEQAEQAVYQQLKQRSGYSSF